MRCLRVDLSGLGDSPTRPGRTEGVEFPADGLEDVAQIRREITAAFGPQILVVGLCSGGHYALESALADPVLSVCVVNPAISIYPWDVQPERRFEPNEGAAILDSGSAHPLISKTMAKLAPLRDAARRSPVGWWVLKRFFVKVSPAQIFERLTQSGAQVLVVAGGTEDRRLREGQQRRFRSLTRQGSFSLEVFPDLEHSLLERSGRGLVFGSCTNFWCAVSPAGPRPHPDRSAGVLRVRTDGGAVLGHPDPGCARFDGDHALLGPSPGPSRSMRERHARERGRPFAAPWPWSSEETPVSTRPAGSRPSGDVADSSGRTSSWAPHLP